MRDGFEPCRQHRVQAADNTVRVLTPCAAATAATDHPLPRRCTISIRLYRVVRAFS
jgi:hypothetical protein